MAPHSTALVGSRTIPPGHQAFGDRPQPLPPGWPWLSARIWAPRRRNARLPIERGGTVDAAEHEDLSRLLNELAAKGYRPAQLEAVRSEWEAACQAGAHPDLAAAVRALEPGVEGRRP